MYQPEIDKDRGVLFQNVIVPVDVSEHTRQAVEYAASLSEQFGAQLSVLQVMSRAGSHQIPEGLKEFTKIEHPPDNEADILNNVANAIVGRAKEQAKSLDAFDALLTCEI